MVGVEGPRLPAHRTLRTGANEGDRLLEEGAAEARAVLECASATPKARHAPRLAELRQACSKARWVSSALFVTLLGTGVFFHLTHGDGTTSQHTDLVNYALKAGSSPLEGRCSELGCGGFDLSYACQCNPGCRKRGNCCPDYEESCPVPLENTTIPSLCSLLGCSTLRTGDESCQCHPHCKKEGNCCSDYSDVCTIEENIARALPDLGGGMQACSKVGGKYTERRSKMTVTVRQSECKLEVQVGASRHAGSVAGRSISVRSFRSSGTLLEGGDVEFGDGGYWARDTVDAPLRTLEDGAALGGPESEEQEGLKHMVVQGARTPLAQIVHNVLRAPIWHEMGV